MPSRLIAAAVLAASFVPAAAHAQCADGSPPPCVSRPAPAPARQIDRNVVAVLPFHVTTSDTLLGEGFAELLTSEFTGESGAPRALDMGTVLADWRRSGGRPRVPLPRERALAIARTLGAGLMTEGSIVGLGRQITVTARLYEVPSGRPIGEGTRVQAHADSLDTALRQTASNLLASYGAPRSAAVGARFTSSPEAMRSYLQGLVEYRRGRLSRSSAAFEQAIALDSTFAQAIYRRYWLQFWSQPPVIRNAQIWGVRQRLSTLERSIVEVILGPNFPDTATTPEIVNGAVRLAATMSDSPEALFFAGDELYHYGPSIDASDHLERARDFMLRAYRVDSQATTLRHLVEIASYLRDTALLRQSIAPMLRSEDPSHQVYAWIAAAQIGDTLTLARVRRELTTEGMNNRFTSLAQLPALPHKLMDELYDRWERALPTPEAQRAFRQGALAAILATQGRLREASEASVGQRETLLLMALANAIPGASADTLAQTLLGGRQANDVALRRRQCWVALTQLQRGDTTITPPANGDAGCTWAYELVRLTKSPQFSRIALAEHEAAYRARFSFGVRGYEAYLLAQAWEKLGDPRRALAAIRLRSAGGIALPAAPWVWYDEGRLALAAGDTVGAIRAYRNYADYMASADANFAERRAHARAEVARLTRR